MATMKTQSTKPMQFRQRRPRQTANPVVSNKPDVYVEFNTSKLGIRVRSGEGKNGLYVAAVTNEAPATAKDKIPEGAQIISVNEHILENSPFDEAVEHFAKLTLPITVRFRPPLHPPKKQQHHGHHDHDHDHPHSHHNDDDDEEEGTCYIACYMILFVIAFMVLISMSLNGFPGLPTSLPSMPRLFPSRQDRLRNRNRNNRANTMENAINDKIKDQLRGKENVANNANNNRKILMEKNNINDIIGDMNNIHTILDNVDMNLEDINVDELVK